MSAAGPAPTFAQLLRKYLCRNDPTQVPLIASILEHKTGLPVERTTWYLDGTCACSLGTLAVIARCFGLTPHQTHQLILAAGRDDGKVE